MSEATSPRWGKVVWISLAVLAVLVILALASPAVGKAARGALIARDRIVSHDINVPHATISCPDGWRVTGGGAEVKRPATYIQSSYPVDEQKWSVRVQNRAGKDKPGPWTIYAVCAR